MRSLLAYFSRCHRRGPGSQVSFVVGSENANARIGKVCLARLVLRIPPFFFSQALFFLSQVLFFLSATLHYRGRLFGDKTTPIFYLLQIYLFFS